MTPDTPVKITILAATVAFTALQKQLFDDLKKQS